VGITTDYFPLLDTVVVYPSAYRARVVKKRGGFPIESVETRIGESWERGTVVLSWDHAKGGGVDFNDGHNVVLHEFAHQLDSESGETSGSPVLPEGSCYSTWARVLGKEYKRLTIAFLRKQKTLIKKYGASHPAEFFAVVTEAFFERPDKLKAKHKNLYEQLVKLYGQDPSEQREKGDIEKATTDCGQKQQD